MVPETCWRGRFRRIPTADRSFRALVVPAVAAIMIGTRPPSRSPLIASSSASGPSVRIHRWRPVAPRLADSRLMRDFDPREVALLRDVEDRRSLEGARALVANSGFALVSAQMSAV